MKGMESREIIASYLLNNLGFKEGTLDIKTKNPKVLSLRENDLVQVTESPLDTTNYKDLITSVYINNIDVYALENYYTDTIKVLNLFKTIMPKEFVLHLQTWLNKIKKLEEHYDKGSIFDNKVKNTYNDYVLFFDLPTPLYIEIFNNIKNYSEELERLWRSIVSNGTVLTKYFDNSEILSFNTLYSISFNNLHQLKRIQLMVKTIAQQFNIVYNINFIPKNFNNNYSKLFNNNSK